MGLLDQMMGGGMQGNPFAQYQQMQANPFTRQIPGTEYLGGMGQDSGNPMGGGMGAPQDMPYNESQIPTDFAGVPPGLPNLPEDMQGFGFGQAAPEMNVNNGLRQSLIQNLLSQLMQQSGSGGGMMGMARQRPMPGMGQGGMGGGMGGMPGMGSGF